MERRELELELQLVEVSEPNNLMFIYNDEFEEEGFEHLIEEINWNVTIH